MCFTKRSSVIKLIYSGQQLFSYKLKQEDTTYIVLLSFMLTLGDMGNYQNVNSPKRQLAKKSTLWFYVLVQYFSHWTKTIKLTKNGLVKLLRTFSHPVPAGLEPSPVGWWGRFSTTVLRHFPVFPFFKECKNGNNVAPAFAENLS